MFQKKTASGEFSRSSVFKKYRFWVIGGPGHGTVDELVHVVDSAVNVCSRRWIKHQLLWLDSEVQ